MNTYKRYRYPSQIISHAVWLYHRFTLSSRDIEDILAERGIIVSYETIRQWCLKITPSLTRKLKKKQGKLGDKWYLDEVFIKLSGKAHYLWRAVDQGSYKASLQGLGIKTSHDTKQYANNIAEISHQKTRQQQRKMRNFKSMKHAQRFLSSHGIINNLFRHQRHLAKAETYRSLRENSFKIWAHNSCAQNLVIA